jgi:hypothetical protein
VNLVITIVGSGGTVMSGALPPAGNPIAISNSSEYAHTMTDAHPEQVGNVVTFPGPLQVTNSAAFVNTNSDGGTRTEGFEVTGGIWVDDTFIYRNCLSDAGVNLSNGIRGVWDRYQDYYSGTAMSPAPTVPVLYPMSCSDVSL